MTRPSSGPEPAGGGAQVVLAREPVFALSHLTVTPAVLGVASGGWSQRLEPRAMQVLVVLAAASPAVVGRAELNARVWGGRVVGEDAINRAVQMLRRLAADAPAPAPFAIDTIPRVGYRLTPGAGEVAAPAPVSSRDTRPAWIAVVAIAVLLAALLAWHYAPSRVTKRAAWRIARSEALDDLPPGASDVALSPDGRRLAYRGRDGAGHERVFVRAAADGGVGSAVSPPQADARRPVWSPDSRALAFATYDVVRPCRLYVLRDGVPAKPVGACETVRDPRLAWSTDGRSLLLGDAPGENAVQRITAIGLGGGRRTVLSSPPGDSLGDGWPIAQGGRIVFQRLFGWADEGWIARDLSTGAERLLWRRHGVAGSVAAPMPDGTLAVAWTRAGASGLDVIAADGRAGAQPVALGPVTALSAAGTRLLVETDRSESALARAGDDAAPPLANVRGRISGPLVMPDGRLRFPATAAGVARIWERDGSGAVRPWGPLVAARISGLALSPNGRTTAALMTGNEGREVVLLDAVGRPFYRWNPHARSVNPAAWTADGRSLIVPVLDGAGWQLFALDPFGDASPRDLALPGFAVLIDRGPALYAVRAGEMTGVRELWRIDGEARRLPIDLTLFDIVNWRPVDGGVWLPDRRARGHPRLVLRDIANGRVLRSLAAPGLAGAGSGLAADARGPVYVQVTRDAPEYAVLTLSRDR